MATLDFIIKVKIVSLTASEERGLLVLNSVIAIIYLKYFTTNFCVNS